MIVNVKGDIKNIPTKYSEIDNIEDLIDDLHHRRMSKTERENFDLQLMKIKMASFITGVRNTPGLRDIIQIAEPIKAVKVTNLQETYYVIRFGNGKEIRCKASIYQSSPIKDEIKRLY